MKSRMDESALEEEAVILSLRDKALLEIENERKRLRHEREQWEAERLRMQKDKMDYDAWKYRLGMRVAPKEGKVKLNIGGTLFVTLNSTLMRHPHSLFGKMLAGEYGIAPDENGEYFIDRDPMGFPVVLNLLRGEPPFMPENFSPELKHKLRRDAEFYNLPRLRELLVAKSESNSSINDVGPSGGVTDKSERDEEEGAEEVEDSKEVQFVGFAEWYQNALLQADEEQNKLMNKTASKGPSCCNTHTHTESELVGGGRTLAYRLTIFYWRVNQPIRGGLSITVWSTGGHGGRIHGRADRLPARHQHHREGAHLHGAGQHRRPRPRLRVRPRAARGRQRQAARWHLHCTKHASGQERDHVRRAKAHDEPRKQRNAAH